MHGEAFQAGLDPNDMDGGGWAEFYGDEECNSLSVTIACISSDCRILLGWIDDLIARDLVDEDERYLNTEERAKATRKYLPEFTNPEQLLEMLG